MTPTAADWLVSLYPASWRARYGEEFRLMLVEQRLTALLALDVIGGAIDARLMGGRMTVKMMARCAAGGPRPGIAEAWRAALVMLGAATAVMGGLIWARAVFEDNPYVDAFAAVAFPALYLVMFPFLHRESVSRRRQMTVLAVTLVILVATTILSVLI